MQSKMTKKQEAKALKKMVRLTDYFSAAQIFLKDNFFLEREIQKDDIKARLLGHWGSCPGTNFTYGNINRQIIKNKDRDFMFIVGPGHGFPAYQSNILIEGSLSKYYPEKIPYSKEGFEEVIRNFSTPYGYPSHLNPEAPGVIAEGGELGYSLAIGAGSVLDNPDLITAVVVGDGEAETGPLSGSWNLNKFLSPKTDGAVLPILHLNGYKISGPTIFGRMNNSEIKKYFNGLGYKVYFIEQHKHKDVYVKAMEVFDKSIQRIKKIQEKARKGQEVLKPEWPVIILKTDKGWTGIKELDGEKIEGNCKAHQIVFDNQKDLAEKPEHLKRLNEWLASYKIDELISFGKDDEIILDEDIKNFIPEDDRRLGSSKYAHGETNQDIKLPIFDEIFVDQKNTKDEGVSSMHEAGKYMRDVMKENNNLRLFSPDETYSNKLSYVFETTKRQWQLPIKSFDTDFGRSGKVIEILSEHLLFGMLWGYTLTGRYGYFVTYEAFGQIVASMADQYVKYLHVARNVKFRKEIPSINVILSSLLERQDHNGFSHQNPSFISNALDRDRDIINVYFPADKNIMKLAMEKTLESKNAFNIIVAGKKMNRTWLNKDEAKILVGQGVSVWDRYSDENPDVVIATAGDYAVEETMAGIKMLRERLPEAKIKFVNFFKLDILAGQDQLEKEDILKNYLTEDLPIIFNYHGYRGTIKKLLFDYNLSERIIINGYEENGSTTSPFDMRARNGLSRMHLLKDVSSQLFKTGKISEEEKNKIHQEMDDMLAWEKNYIIENKDDPDFIKNWEL